MKKTIEFKETGGKRRRGKITFYEGKESDKVKKIRPRTARSINRNLQSMPFNPNLYQLNKFAVPRLNYVQTEQVKEENEKLKALELGLLAQITKQMSDSSRIKTEQEELKKIQRDEQQEEAFLNNQLELFELKERTAQLNDELKNVMTEMNNKNKIIEIIKNDAEVDKVRERQQYELQNQQMAEFMSSLQQQQQQEMDLLKQRNIEANRMNEFRNQQQKMIISEQARQIGELQANQKKRANLSYQIKTDFIIPETQKKEMGMITEAPQMITSGVGTERVISEEIGTQAQPQLVSVASGDPTLRVSSGVGTEAPPQVSVASGDPTLRVSVSRPRLVQSKFPEEELSKLNIMAPGMRLSKSKEEEMLSEQLRKLNIMAPGLGFVKKRVKEIEQKQIEPESEKPVEESEPLRGAEKQEKRKPIQAIKKILIKAINEKRNKNFKYTGKSLNFLKEKALESGISQEQIDSIVGRG
jgi:hypothetical protein